jgi:hypothetical protein
MAGTKNAIFDPRFSILDSYALTRSYPRKFISISTITPASFARYSVSDPRWFD